MSNRKQLITCLFNCIGSIRFLWTPSRQSIEARKGHWLLVLNDMLRGSRISEGWCHPCHQQLWPEWYFYYSFAGLQINRGKKRGKNNNEWMHFANILCLDLSAYDSYSGRLNLYCFMLQECTICSSLSMTSWRHKRFQYICVTLDHFMTLFMEI